MLYLGKCILIPVNIYLWNLAVFNKGILAQLSTAADLLYRASVSIVLFGAVDSRCVRFFSFCCQSCRCLFDHFAIVAALGPESAPLICGWHDSIRWVGVRRANQTALIDVVHGAMFLDVVCDDAL